MFSQVSRSASDLDARGGSGAQPVAVGREDERVDDVPGVEGVETLALLKVPQHGGSILASRGAQRPVGRHGHRVQVPAPTSRAYDTIPLTQRQAGRPTSKPKIKKNAFNSCELSYIA